MDNKLCILIPVYNHGKPLADVVKAVKKEKLPIVIVDDCSTEENRVLIEAVAKSNKECDLVALPKNKGKGGAVIAGLKRANELGYTHAFQVDADGQHDSGKMSFFIEEWKKNPDALVAGAPKYDESVPKARQNGRKITNFWIALETLSFDITDAMCGFRIYPVKKTLSALRVLYVDKRMGFDIEVMVRLYWKGVQFRFYPVLVVYPEDGTSNFRVVRDNIAISLTHSRLFLGMIPRIPVILYRKILRSSKRK